MANVNLPRVSELMRCVFELLWNRPDGRSARELLASIPEAIKLTDYELGWSLSTNTPRYEKIIRMATLPLVKAGWLVKSERGRWYITEDGRQASRRFASAQEMYAEAMRLAESEKQTTPEILMSLEMVQEKAWQLIERYLQERKPMEIRRLLADLMESMQYHITWIAPVEKKHGQIDMVINTDPIGATSYRILVQVKHKGQPVTLEGMKSFLSVLGPNDFGLLMSTGGFTRDVTEQMSSQTYIKINAMDLEKFFDLWIKNFDKLSLESRTRLPLKQIYFLSPSE
jgi:restriction system protein